MAQSQHEKGEIGGCIGIRKNDIRPKKDKQTSRKGKRVH